MNRAASDYSPITKSVIKPQEVKASVTVLAVLGRIIFAIAFLFWTWYFVSSGKIIYNASFSDYAFDGAVFACVAGLVLFVRLPKRYAEAFYGWRSGLCGAIIFFCTLALWLYVSTTAHASYTHWITISNTYGWSSFQASQAQAIEQANTVRLLVLDGDLREKMFVGVIMLTLAVIATAVKKPTAKELFWASACCIMLFIAQAVVIFFAGLANLGGL